MRRKWLVGLTSKLRSLVTMPLCDPLLPGVATQNTWFARCNLERKWEKLLRDVGKIILKVRRKKMEQFDLFI